MKKRTFLASLLALPVTLAGCIHWPGIDNRKRKTVETPVWEKVKASELKPGEEFVLASRPSLGLMWKLERNGVSWLCNGKVQSCVMNVVGPDELVWKFTTRWSIEDDHMPTETPMRDIYWTQTRMWRRTSPAYREAMDRILTQRNGNL